MCHLTLRWVENVFLKAHVYPSGFARLCLCFETVHLLIGCSDWLSFPKCQFHNEPDVLSNKIKYCGSCCEVGQFVQPLSLTPSRAAAFQCNNIPCGDRLRGNVTWTSTWVNQKGYVTCAFNVMHS